ncbi:hypothetical protein ACKKBG_A28080 [Auxenochlorella protothecoides x Auxenochlorella symbiontica]
MAMNNATSLLQHGHKLEGAAYKAGMLGEAPSALAALVELLRSLDGTSQQASVPHPGPSPPSTMSDLNYIRQPAPGPMAAFAPTLHPCTTQNETRPGSSGSPSQSLEGEEAQRSNGTPNSKGLQARSASRSLEDIMQRRREAARRSRRRKSAQLQAMEAELVELRREVATLRAQLACRAGPARGGSSAPSAAMPAHDRPAAPPRLVPAPGPNSGFRPYFSTAEGPGVRPAM